MYSFVIIDKMCLMPDEMTLPPGRSLETPALAGARREYNDAEPESSLE